MNSHSAPKHPAHGRSRPPGVKDSPRKSSYTVSMPTDIIPALNLVNREKPKNGLEKNNLVLFQNQFSNEATLELKNGSRSDVIALEKWTHTQLAEIHLQHNEKGSAEKIKVLDSSADLLAKMIEIHCLDKARFMRKLWSSSADLFNSIYTDLSSAIHDLKLKLSDKNILCTKLEDTLLRMRTSLMTPNVSRAQTAAEALNVHNKGDGCAHLLETGFTNDATERIRLLEEELLLKNQEMMQLQSTLTSLSVWFPNFSKFNSSILSKYLPPIDYLEQLERVREEEEKKEQALLQAQRAKEQEELFERQGKSGKLAKQRSTLGVIGENKVGTDQDGGKDQQDKDGKARTGNISALQEEMHGMDLAQGYLLKDLKRLQGLGVGFAVLDPQEFEAAQEAVKTGFIVANSAGVFPASGAGGGGGAASAGSTAAATSTAVLSNPSKLPQSLMRALGRTSVAVTNKYKSRVLNLKSFVEAQADEYTLSAVSQEPSAAAAGGDFGAGASVKATTRPINPMAAAAAAAVQNVMMMEIDTANSALSSAAAPAAKNVPVSPIQTDLRMGDFFKLQNVRVTKINGEETKAAVAQLAKHLSAKNKPEFYASENKTGDGADQSGQQKEPDEGDDGEDSEEREYELKFRALLIDAQKLEVAKAAAERKMKEEKKAHHRQLLRMSAQVTTLQNKLAASNRNANAMLQKIPHVVFSPMLRRDITPPAAVVAISISAESADWSAVHGNSNSKVTQKGSVSADSTRYKDNSVRPASEAPGDETVTDVSALNSLFEQSFGDMEVLLNNTRRSSSNMQRSSVLQEESSVSTVRSIDSLSQTMQSTAAVGVGGCDGEAAAARGSDLLAPPSQHAKARQWSIADIETLVIRFCRHFTQSSPTPLHNHSVDGSNPSAGMNVRDELHAAFGQGPDQWTKLTLSAELNGQHATLLGNYTSTSQVGGVVTPLLMGEGCAQPDKVSAVHHHGSVTFARDVPQRTAHSSHTSVRDSAEVGVLNVERTAFGAHLLQYLASSGYSRTSLTTSSTTVQQGLHLHHNHVACLHAGALLQQFQAAAINHLQHLQHYKHPHNPSSCVSGAPAPALSPPYHSFVRCVAELLCLHDVTSSGVDDTKSNGYLESLRAGNRRQQSLRQKIFFDIFLCGYSSMQRYLSISPTNAEDGNGRPSTTVDFQRRTFAVTTTGRLLRRMFTIVGDDRTGTKKKSQQAQEVEVQSPPWWQCLTDSAFNDLKYDVEMTAVAEHRAHALKKLLLAQQDSFAISSAHVETEEYFLKRDEDEEEEEAPAELRVDCYECIHRCMRAVEISHSKLMKVLMNMYRFLQSLSLRNGASNRTFHLLLAHFLQQEYPSVKDVGSGFSISAVAQGDFSFAARTAIVVNLELMYEIQTLAAAGALNAATFADAVLRSQPNYLVHSLYPLLEPTSAKTAALRTKMIADGTHHVETLKEMLLRAHQQLTAESIPSVPAVVSSPFGSPHSMKHLAALSASSSARAPPISSSAKVSSSASLLRSVTEAAATATSSESGAINTTSGAAGSAPGRKAGTAVARATLLTAKLSLNSNKTTDGPKPSHFKQSYLLNKLLYPEETGVTHPLRLSSHDGGGGSGAADEEFLLQDMVSLESLLGEEVVASTARGSATDASSDDLSAVPVRIHDFIQKILLHAKLSYDGNISGVMAPSIAQVALTTWTLQYVVETLLRLRGSSMRLKVLFRKDMGIYQHVPLSPRIGSLSPGGTTGKHKTAARNPSDAATVANAAGANNSNNNIGSLGDYVLIDLLLGDVDLDMFVRVEAHYMRALQKKVFRAWSAAVEDVHNAIHL